MLVFAAAASVYVWQTRIPPVQAVTVRPFTAEGGPAWLAGAISEEIADVLRPVTKPTADPAYSGILEGTVTPAGDRVRVTARLSRPDGHRYWTRTFERPLPDIATDIAGAVARLPRRKPASHKPAPKAFESYFEGRHLFREGDLARAIDGFERATQADSELGPAWAWLAIGKEYLAEQDTMRPNELMPVARDAAERAVTLDTGAACAHLALGVVKLQYDWDWETARRELERALELDPGNPLALHWRERWLQTMNQAPAVPLHLPNVPTTLDAAHSLLDQAEDLRTTRYISPILLALTANFAKDSESLFIWLNVAYDERSVQLPYLLRSPELPQSDPRLIALIRRLKLPANP